MRVRARTRYLAPALLSGLSIAAGAAEEPGDVRETGDRVAAWQLDHMDGFDYVRTFREQTSDSTDWIQAAFYIGLTRWAAATGDGRYRAALAEHAAANDWRLGPHYWHADSHAIAYVYLSVAANGAPSDLSKVTAGFDRVIAEHEDTSLAFEIDESWLAEGTCQRRWCWCDALFMAPPAWAMLSRITGDPVYLDHALDEYFATQDFLYDDEHHLFYRDSRFFGQRTPHGNKVFWSRGNGWVFAGLPLLLEAMPDDDPRRERLTTLFREMAEALGSLQHPGGYWGSSLLDVAHDPPEETSGTAFITFGLAWGVNEGLLDERSFGTAIDRGWNAIAGAVDPDGRLGYVQQVGNAPDEVRPTDTQLYGSGALLLAASELLRR